MAINPILSVFLLNCHSLFANLGEIKLLLYTKKPDLFCLCETWMKESSQVPSFIGYESVWKHRGSPGGGLAILIRRGIQHRNFPLNTFQNGVLEVQAIVLLLANGGQTTVLNIYNPSKDVSTAEFQHYFAQLGTKYIIVGDFNAHTQLLDSACLRSNKTGVALEEVLLDGSVCLANPIDFFTYLDSRTGKRSALDLCLTSSDLISSVNMALSSDVGSDHCAVSITCAVQPVVNESFGRPRWKDTPSSLRAFTADIPDCTLYQPLNLDVAVADITNRITLSATKHIKKTTGHFRPHKQTAWWNDECMQAVAERHHASNVLARHPTRANLNEYQLKSATVKQVCKASKKKSWQKFASTLTMDTPISEVWRKFNAVKSRYVPVSYPLLHLEQPITDPVAKANIFGEYFSHNCTTGASVQLGDMDDIPQPTEQDVYNTHEEDYNCDITQHELQRAIQHTRNTTPGNDNIPNIFLRCLPLETMAELLGLFNQSFTTGFIPLQWKQGIVIPIPKPGKNKESVESYRPITLLSCMSKVLERIITSRLDFLLELRLRSLSGSQCGFRRGHSTMDVLLRIEHEIRRSLASQEICVVVYVDLKSAYDKIWHAGLLHKIRKCGVKGKLLRWLSAYLADRTFHVRVEGSESSLFHAKSGVPQGGVLSPLLFNIMLADMPVESGVQQYIYADDITFSCSGHDPMKVKQTMETYLLSFEKWCLTWGVVINPLKTKVQHFTRKRIPCPDVQFCGATITYNKVQRLLGLLLDSPLLTWVQHVQYLRVEGIKRLNVMKALSSTNWGADNITLMIFYIAYVRAKLDYGSILYDSALESHLHKLEVLQNSCMRLILGARRSTPILSLQAETHLPSLSLRRNYLSANTFIKLLHRPTNDATVSALRITSYSNQVHQAAPICSFVRRTHFFLMVLDIGNIPRQMNELLPTVPPWESAAKFVSLGEGEADCNPLFQKYVSTNYLTYNQIYCDGSQLQNPLSTASGMFVSVAKQATCWRLNPHHSVIAAELFAIWKSLQYVALHKTQDFIIFSDSRSALQLLQAPSTTYIAIVDKIVRLLLYVNCTRTVVVHWVRAHVGIVGNEIADKTAKLGHSANVSALYKLSREEYLANFHALFRSYWDESWKNDVLISQKGRFLHNIRTTVHQVLPISTTKRREAIVLYRLRMGHVGLLDYLHRFNMRDSDLCEVCALPETVEHYFLHCSAYNIHRQELYDRLFTLDVVHPTLQNLLGSGDYSAAKTKKILRLTMAYVRNTGRLEEL